MTPRCGTAEENCGEKTGQPAAKSRNSRYNDKWRKTSKKSDGGRRARMIYYFSGTGNSRWAAMALATELNDIACDIAACLRNWEEIRLNAGDALGIVFPVYAWGPPNIVKRFLKQLHIPSDVFCYAVCTCGDEAGNAIGYLQRLMRIDSGYSLQMPNNYIVLYDVDDQETERRKLAEAKKRIPSIAQEIRERKPVFAVRAGRLSALKTALFYPTFYLFARNPKPFYAEGRCTACGLCVRSCPTGNIALESGKPVWGPDCEHCMACINRCPVRAIQYGGYTKNKGRYFLKEME